MGKLNPQTVYTVEALAAELGLAERTIREKAKQGKIPGIKAYGRYYFKGSEVIKHLRDIGKEYGDLGDW